MEKQLSFTENEMSFGLSYLTRENALVISGGSFWGDAAYVLGATLRCIWEFSKTAAEFQSSLPANLKK
jgi:hypothetical protein